MSANPIEFFYDLGTPYSFMASTQLKHMRARTGLDVQPRAFLLGGVFKASGNESPAAVLAKGRQVIADLDRWRRFYDVEFKFSPHFPFNTLYLQRMLAAQEREDPEAAERLMHSLFRSFWVDEADPTDPDALALGFKRAEVDCAALLAAAQAPEIKALLREVTDEAVGRGAFGAPTFFVGNRMWWGNDRIPLMEWELRA